MASQAPTGEAIDRLIITPRPLSDYRDMFLLTDADLTAGPILDCPGGASPFGAQVRARAGSVVSVDRAYRLSRDELAERVRRDTALTETWTAANRESFNWAYLGSPVALRRLFEVAADLFLIDYAPDGERYVAASLPTLPFPDGAFRLTLSSHLLFCYPEYFTYEGHLTGIVELMRVTSGELRIFPLVDTTGRPYPRMDELCAALAERGILTETAIAACSYLAGGDSLLRCRWKEPR
ncbi:MAG: hypothetical protein GEU94_10920 [Micromonosporaceae bacterium]|nr:hypothetical protein [Micromonosporaceae bacterium]